MIRMILKTYPHQIHVPL